MGTGTSPCPRHLGVLPGQVLWLCNDAETKNFFPAVTSKPLITCRAAPAALEPWHTRLALSGTSELWAVEGSLWGRGLQAAEGQARCRQGSEEPEVKLTSQGPLMPGRLGLCLDCLSFPLSWSSIGPSCHLVLFAQESMIDKQGMIDNRVVNHHRMLCSAGSSVVLGTGAGGCRWCLVQLRVPHGGLPSSSHANSCGPLVLKPLAGYGGSTTRPSLGRGGDPKPPVLCSGAPACPWQLGPLAKHGSRGELLTVSAGRELGWETASCQKHFHRNLSPPTNISFIPLPFFFLLTPTRPEGWCMPAGAVGK